MLLAIGSRALGRDDAVGPASYGAAVSTSLSSQDGADVAVTADGARVASGGQSARALSEETPKETPKAREGCTLPSGPGPTPSRGSGEVTPDARILFCNATRHPDSAQLTQQKEPRYRAPERCRSGRSFHPWGPSDQDPVERRSSFTVGPSGDSRFSDRDQRTVRP